VSGRLATRLFATQSAIGREIYLTGPAQSFEIVGVAGDVNHRALDEAPLETVYLSAWQWPSRSSHILVRSQRPAADVIDIVREEVARLDRDMPVYAIRSMAEVVAASPGMPARRVLTATFSAFALLAVALSAIGLFGAMAHDVASRRPELALRLALGANPGRLLTATLRQAAAIVAAGVVLGLLLSVWAGEALRNLAPTTDRFDVVSAATAAGVLLIVGLCAVLPVARRASRTDPVVALRNG
jgi:ABC-type antimicrobial peptide transport system permease subunit